MRVQIALTLMALAAPACQPRDDHTIGRGITIAPTDAFFEWGEGADSAWVQTPLKLKATPGEDVYFFVEKSSVLGIKFFKSSRDDGDGGMELVAATERDGIQIPAEAAPAKPLETTEMVHLATNSDDESYIEEYYIYTTECFDGIEDLTVKAYVDTDENGRLDPDEKVTPVLTRRVSVRRKVSEPTPDDFIDDEVNLFTTNEISGHRGFFRMNGARLVSDTIPGAWIPGGGRAWFRSDEGKLATKFVVCGTAAAALRPDDTIRNDVGAQARVLDAVADPDGNTCVTVVDIKSRSAFAPGEELEGGPAALAVGELKSIQWGVLEGDAILFSSSDGSVEAKVEKLLDDKTAVTDAPAPSEETDGEVSFYHPAWLDLRWDSVEKISESEYKAIGFPEVADVQFATDDLWTWQDMKILPNDKVVTTDDQDIRVEVTLTQKSEFLLEFDFEVSSTTSKQLELYPSFHWDIRDGRLSIPSTNAYAPWALIYRWDFGDVAIYGKQPCCFDRTAPGMVAVSPIEYQLAPVTNGSPFGWGFSMRYEREFLGGDPTARGGTLFRPVVDSLATSDAAPLPGEVTGNLKNVGEGVEVIAVWKAPVPTLNPKTGEYETGPAGRHVTLNEIRVTEDGDFSIPVLSDFNGEPVDLRVEIYRSGNVHSLVDNSANAGADVGSVDFDPGMATVRFSVKRGGLPLSGVNFRLRDDRNLYLGLEDLDDNGGMTPVNGEVEFRVKPGSWTAHFGSAGQYAYFVEESAAAGETIEREIDLQDSYGIGFDYQFLLAQAGEEINDATKGDPLTGYVSVDYARSGASPDSWVSRRKRILSAVPLNILIVADENRATGGWDSALSAMGLSGKVRIVTGTELASRAAGRSLGFPVASAPNVAGLDAAQAVTKLKEQSSFVLLPRPRRIDAFGNGMFETPQEGYPKRLSKPLSAHGVEVIRSLGADGIEIMDAGLSSWVRDDLFAMFNHGYFPTLFAGSGSRNQGFDRDLAGVARTYVYWPDFPETGSSSIGETLAQKLKAGDVYATSGPRVVCLYDADQDGTPETRMGSLVHDPDGKGDLHIVVLAENRDPVDRVTLWQDGKETQLSGVASNPDEMSTDPSTLVRFKEIVPVQFNKDTWFVVEVLGYGTLFSSFRWKTTGIAHALAYTNAIRIDHNGDGSVDVE